jgi:hypothetical protein
MEETMRLLTANELWRLTRIELLDLVNRITNKLPTFPEGSPERANALASLRNIQHVLVRRVSRPDGLSEAAHAVHARASCGAFLPRPGAKHEQQVDGTPPGELRAALRITGRRGGRRSNRYLPIRAGD